MQKRKISESRRKRRRQLCRRIVGVGITMIIGGGLFASKWTDWGDYLKDFNLLVLQESPAFFDSWIGAPEIESMLLDVNEYSRPGTRLKKVNGIVIHYVGNPNTSAIANRNYFNGLQHSHEAEVSSHFVVGLEGEIIQCVPVEEISYASNHRNSDTISIECCHPDASGIFKESTYKSMVELTGWLCFRFGLTKEDVIRHYDVTGKECPKYFVDNEEAWNRFLNDVDTRIQEIKVLAEQQG